MTSPVTVVIGGLPTAKGRPRMTRLGIAYTPAATRKYEAHGSAPKWSTSKASRRWPSECSRRNRR
jgi:hypothetical protein